MKIQSSSPHTPGALQQNNSEKYNNNIKINILNESADVPESPNWSNKVSMGLKTSDLEPVKPSHDT